MCPAIVWDESGSRLYETGVDHGVLYPQAVGGDYPAGVAWNGLTAVTESPTGAEATPLFADNIKYLNMVSAEQCSGTIEAYTYPEEFAPCDGSAEPVPGVIVQQQTRKAFGMCYRTKIGNDVEGIDYGYKLHLIYGAQAAPSEKAHSTINETPEAITLSWAFTTTPVPVTGLKPTASLVIDSTKVDPLKMVALEKLLYGDLAIPAALPMPDAIIALITAV